MLLRATARRPNEGPELKRVYLVPNRCLGCEECIEACKREHDWVACNYIEWVNRIYPVQMVCNHCADAPCEQICPVQAIHRTETGAVVVEDDRCIGCTLCNIVCPFGIPKFSEEERHAIKCDQCAERVAAGKEPACVEACPMKALAFAEVEDYEAERRERTARRILEVGTCLRRFVAKKES